MKPSAQQRAAMVLAEADGYVRPASPTHARRCHTSIGGLARTAKSCVAAGWMKQVGGGLFVLTDEGREFVPSTNKPDWWEDM